MKKLIQQNLSLGIHEGLTKNEEKLVRLLNQICFTWYCIILFFISSDYFLEEKYLQILPGHIFQFIVLTIVQYLQKKQKYHAARVLFVTVSFVQFYIFTNFLLTGNLIEFFYILIPLFSILFLNDKRYHYFYLALAIVSFVVPRKLMGHYNEVIFADPTTMPILFIAIFLLVNYFKNLNLKNEALLEEKRNDALNQITLIETQKKELEELHEFQNQFFINVAHEIRTPLTIIRGNLTKIKKGISLEQNEIQLSLEQVDNQSAKIQEIVTNVMDLSKMNANNFELNPELISISTFVNRIYISFSSNFQNKNIAYTFEDKTTHDLCLKADPIYLESAVNNILNNAIKYTPENHFVQVELSQDELKKELYLKISDTGIGISESDKQKIFNRFYQVNNSINRAGGSGVGLAFCKEIILKSGGKISVESELQKGSTFTITLPVHSISTEISPLNSIVPTQKSAEKKKHSFAAIDAKNILLADDHTEMREYIKSILPQYNIFEASNGIEALKVIENEKIDLLISDYMMPEKDGYELISELRTTGVNLPVIMLTARHDFESKIKSLRLGIDDYLSKPFEEEELLTRIKYSLRNDDRRLEFLEVEQETEKEIIIEDSFVLDLRNYIEENCVKSYFSMTEICEQFALSNSSLYRKIKTLCGLSPKEFITEVRLQKAKTIFEQNPTIGLKELSLEVGYVNYTHFGNLYSERFAKKISL